MQGLAVALALELGHAQAEPGLGVPGVGLDDGGEVKGGLRPRPLLQRRGGGLAQSLAAGIGFAPAAVGRGRGRRHGGGAWIWRLRLASRCLRAVCSQPGERNLTMRQYSPR